MYPLRRAARYAAMLAVAGLGLAASLSLSGCHNFFVCQKASCPTSGGSTTTDYVYISDSTSGNTYISAYDLSSGSLTAISGSPYNIDFAPVALSISPNNAFLYAATLPGASNPGIFAFNIGTGGVLSSANGGDVLISTPVSAMDISPDGNYLFVVNSGGSSMTEYTVNTSTGALALAATIALPVSTCSLSLATPVSQTCAVKVAPSGEFVVVSLGTAGTAIFPYSSSSGITSTAYTLISPGSTTTGDYSVALDSSNRIYIARTTALAVYQITDSSRDATLQSTVTYGSSAVPRSVVLSTDYDYVYTANQGTSNISGYGIGSAGALTAASGSPFTGPTDVSALGVDKSGSFMVSAGYNSSSGVQLFSIGSTGALTLVTSAGTGTSTAYPVVLAMSH